MIFQNVDRVKVRIRDAIRRRDMGLPPAEDESDLLERALLVIEDLEEKQEDRFR